VPASLLTLLKSNRCDLHLPGWQAMAAAQPPAAVAAAESSSVLQYLGQALLRPTELQQPLQLRPAVVDAGALLLQQRRRRSLRVQQPAAAAAELQVLAAATSAAAAAPVVHQNRCWLVSPPCHLAAASVPSAALHCHSHQHSHHQQQQHLTQSLDCCCSPQDHHC
jgi:hypothetical protein